MCPDKFEEELLTQIGKCNRYYNYSCEHAALEVFGWIQCYVAKSQENEKIIRNISINHGYDLDDLNLIYEELEEIYNDQSSCKHGIDIGCCPAGC